MQIQTVVKNVLNTYFTTVFKKAVKNVLDRQTLCFTVANVFYYEKQYTCSKNSNENRRYWAILAAPVVANSGKEPHVVFLCNLKRVLIYTWVAKPFILPLQMFALSKIKITVGKNSNETRRIWATLAAPVVAYNEKNNMWFACVNWFTHGSPNPLFYRCKIFCNDKTIHFFKKPERKRGYLSKTGGSRRRQ